MAENLSGPELTKLYNSPVCRAELMKRNLGSLPFKIGIISHTGVRVTLSDGSQWLIHKGPEYGKASETVVTKACNMTSEWEFVEERDFDGSKTVGDFVRVGDADYNVFFNNCHHASERMMEQ